jgi:hypothetical protein
MQQIEIANENKKTFFLERLPIWYKAMVRSLDCYWNQFVPSLYMIHGKLADLGVAIVDGEVSYRDNEPQIRAGPE